MPISELPVIKQYLDFAMKQSPQFWQDTLGQVLGAGTGGMQPGVVPEELPGGVTMFKNPEKRDKQDAETQGENVIHGSDEALPFTKVHELGHIDQNRSDEGSTLIRMLKEMGGLGEGTLGAGPHGQPIETEAPGRGFNYLSKIEDDPKAGQMIGDVQGGMENKLDKGQDQGGFIQEALQRLGSLVNNESDEWTKRMERLDNQNINSFIEQ